MKDEKSLVENLHFTNLKKAEGYFEQKRKNYQVATPTDLAESLTDEIEACSIEREI